MKRPPVRPIRVEETLLPLLRREYQDRGVVFGSLRDRGNPERECVLVAEPQGMATPVSQYVRVRMIVIARRQDGSGDFTEAQHLASDIIQTVTTAGQAGPVISAALDSGPVRQEEDGLVFAYAVLLLQARTQ